MSLPKYTGLKAGTNIYEFVNCVLPKWEYDMDPIAVKQGHHKPYQGTGIEAFRGPKLKARKD